MQFNYEFMSKIAEQKVNKVLKTCTLPILNFKCLHLTNRDKTWLPESQ